MKVSITCPCRLVRGCRWALSLLVLVALVIHALLSYSEKHAAAQTLRGFQNK